MKPVESMMAGSGDKRVSIVMPVYNGAAFLERAVSGVLTQTHADWELLIVDDGSSDGSLELAEEVEKRDRRIRVLTHPGGENRGVAASRNLAVREASGVFLATLDCDDEWLPHKLARQLEVMEDHPETVFVYALAETIDAEGNRTGETAGTGVPGGSFDLFELLVTGKIWVPCPTVLVRTESVRDCGGFDESLDYQIEDHLLFTRLAEIGPVYFLFEILARYRAHPATWTATLSQRRRSRAYMQYCDRLIRSVPGYRRPLVSREYVDKWRKLAAQGGLRYVLLNLPGVTADLVGLIFHHRVRLKDKLRALALPWQWPLGKLIRLFQTAVSNRFRAGRLGRRMDRRLKVGPKRPCPDRIRSGILAYINAMAVTEGPIGRYRFSASSGPPLLYASVYALMTRHLLGDLIDLTDDQAREWAVYLLGFQCRDGLFRDPAVAAASAEIEDDWGWRHLSTHVITALTILGIRSRYPFASVNFLYGEGNTRRWLKSLNWREGAPRTSNRVMNYGVLLQYNRDFWQQREAGESLDEMTRFLEEIEDPRTGLWGGPFPAGKNGLSLMQQSAYHIWMLYAFDQRPVPHVEKAVDSCLALQNRWGGFGPGAAVPYHSNPFTSACEDIDAIDPLCRFYRLTGHRREEITSALKRALAWVLINRNPDGGFVFRRAEKLVYGHPLMASAKEESNMFATWFRTLSLAYISKILPSEPTLENISFQFVRCPGYQFWHPSSMPT